MASVHIAEFTDPSCPFGYNAGPALRRLAWHLGDEAEWELRMVVLTATPEEAAEKASFLTPEKMAEGDRRLSGEHGMPAAGEPRARLCTTIDASRAIVAARMRAPGTERPLIRALRRRYFGLLELYDEPETIAAAARDAGLDPDALAAWSADPEVEQALNEDMARARSPHAAARALDHKLGGPAEERRYTCPSLVITRLSDGAEFEAPGFWPYSAYDLLISNIVPDARVRGHARDVAEILAWAGGEPLATREIAELRGVSDDVARAELAEIADEELFAIGSYWTPRAATAVAA